VPPQTLWWRLKRRLPAHTARCLLLEDSWSWTDVLVDWLEPVEWLSKVRDLNSISACKLNASNLMSSCLNQPVKKLYKTKTSKFNFMLASVHFTNDVWIGQGLRLRTH
jgi:hypothetical protein